MGAVQDKDKPTLDKPDNKRQEGSKASNRGQTVSDAAPDLSCGIGKCRTNIFGKYFANLYMFSILLGISSFFLSAVNSALPTHIMSLRMHMSLNGEKFARIFSMFTIGMLTTSLFPGHFTKRVNIPAMLGSISLIQGLVMTLPALVQWARPYRLPIVQNKFNSNVRYLCHIKEDPAISNFTTAATTAVVYSNITILDYNTTTASSGQSFIENESQEVAYIVLLMIQLVRGITMSFHSDILSIVYIDDNTTDKTKMSFFIGIKTVIVNLAYPVGKSIVGVITEVPIDLSDTLLTPEDGRFVSAWWLSFLIFGIGTILTSLPLLFFPRRLISDKQQQMTAMKASEAYKSGSEMVIKDVEGDKEEITETSSRRVSTLVAALPTAMDSDERKMSSYSAEITLSDPRRRSIDQRGAVENPPTKDYPPIETITSGNSQAPSDAKPVKNVLGDSSILELIKDFPRAFYRILKNPFMVAMFIYIIVTALPASAPRMFREDYMKGQFNVDMKKVAVTSSTVHSVATILGSLVSIYLSSKVRTLKGYMLIMLGTHTVALLSSPAYLFLGCDDYKVHAATGEIGIAWNASDSCGCRDMPLLSCGADNQLYYSPCHAGCQSVDGQTFSDCKFLTTNSSGSTLTPGLCPTSCSDDFIYYTIIHGVQETVLAMAEIPQRMLMLRVVDPKDRGFATSTLMFLYLLMMIPGQELAGFFVGKLCHIEFYQQCKLHNRKLFRYALTGVDIATNTAIVVAVGVGWSILHRQIQMYKRKHAAGKNQNPQTTAM